MHARGAAPEHDTAEARALRAAAESRIPRALARDVGQALLLAVVYYVTARLSLRVSLVEHNVTPLWPPTGIALVAFLLAGRRLWPGVALAAFLVNAPITNSPLAAAATAAGNTAAPLVAAWLLSRVGFRAELDRLRDAIALVFLGALLSMMVSATVGAATLAASGEIPASRFPAAWSVWWAGDAMGVLVFAPFLLTFRLPERVHRAGWRRRVEAGVLALALAAVTALVFTSQLHLMFAVLPLLGWAAWRFQQRGAAPAALFVSVAATWSAVAERGPFAGGTLLGDMLALQAFNAAVAFTSFLFAALVAERMRDRAALATWASELERRVANRTGELSRANDELAAEIEERRRVDAELRRSERQLAEAQHLASVGSWEWKLGTGEVTWSDEMYRIHGYRPREFDVTFDKAIERVPPEDQERIRDNVGRALERHRRSVPDIEYPIVLPDGAVRVLHGKAKVVYDATGRATNLIGTVQDITERREHEREHRIAETLQRALLPKDVPLFGALQMATRYVPAEAGLDCGGDWYDVVPLAGGRVGLVIGDVSGHGLEAATVMGQLRLALRAYALEGHAPSVVVANVDALLQQAYPDVIATLVYVEVDPQTQVASIVNAGHPPPLLLGRNGATFLHGPVQLPIGLQPEPAYEATARTLEPASTLLLYTDGLVERHDRGLDDGLERLRSEATRADGDDVDALCDLLLERLVSDEVSDDVAVLAAHISARARGPFDLSLPSDPREVSRMRRELTAWLEGEGVPVDDVRDIVLASSEACANAVEHAYTSRDGEVSVTARWADSAIEVTVRDRGRWRPPRNGGRGRGLLVMQACMDSVGVVPNADGTEVRMRRAVRRSPA